MQSTFTGSQVLPQAPPRPVEELGPLLRLALPLAAANLGQVLIGAVDTAIVGRLGRVELGGAGLGSSIFFTVAVVGLGAMLGLDPLIAQAFGARDRERATRFVWQGPWLALLLGIPLSALALLVGGVLEHLGIDSATASVTRSYLAGRIPGLVPFLLFVGLRSFLQAASVTRPMIIAAMLANVVNLCVGWTLAFGDRGLHELGVPGLGIPAFGVSGAAWAGTIATVVQLFVLLVSLHRAELPVHRPSRGPKPELILRVFALGAPIGLQMLAEFGVFSIVNVLIANIDSLSLAAHQVAITFASATFMIAIAIGAATSVRVGRAVGRGDTAAARRAGLAGVLVSAAVMGLAAMAFAIAPRAIAGIVTDDPEVIAAAAPLLLVAAMFQLSDGIQAVALGALRGGADTRFPLLATLAGHYMFGLPLGIFMAFGLELGARGLWWGLSAGLTLVALGLVSRFIRLTSRPLARA